MKHVLKNQKIFKIGWDCDGVLAYSHQAILKRLNSELSQKLARQINLTKTDLNGWDAVRQLTLDLTGDADLADKLLNYWFDPATLRSAPPNPAVLEVIRRCHALPHTEQSVITTRPHHCAAITKEWLDVYLPQINWSRHLHIRPPGSLLESEAFKSYKIHKLGINFITEDHTPTVIHLLNVAPNCQIGYASQPWNASDTDPVRQTMRVDPDDPEVLIDRIMSARNEFFSCP